MRIARFLLLYIRTVFQRYRFLFVIVLILVAMIGGFIKFNPQFVTKNRISEGVVGTYTERDIPPIVTSLLSRGLVKLDPSGLAKPDLADSWDVNQEANSYIFHLKPNLTWSDGSQIKAKDMSFSIADVEISIPDDKTIIFKLADSFSPFPTLLTKPVLRKDKLIGTGPYTVSNTEMSSVFVKKISLSAKDTNLPDVVIRLYPNEKTAKHALLAGEVESLLGIIDPKDLVQDRPFKLVSAPNDTRLVAIFYNTKDPILSDENFRLALSYAAPSILGEIEAKTSLPSTSWAFNPGVKDYLDNPAQAKASLGRVKNGRDQTITLTATSSLQNIGNQIVQAWNNQGIKAVLRVESGIPQNFQALLISQNIPVDPDQYSLWQGTQTTTNISQFSQPRVDKDLEDGRKTTDLEQRKALYQDFQKALLDHSPATFLYFPKNNIVMLKKIESDLNKILQYQLPSL